MQIETQILAVPIPEGAPQKKQVFPFLDLKAQFASTKSEILEAISRVLASQHFILGPEVEMFEQEVAQLVGCRFAIGCASGSDALLLALMALGVGAGDEVVTSPFTFIATAGAIARLGAKPVFIDIDSKTYNLDSQKLESAITPKTRAIIPVHLFGLMAEMKSILKIASRHNVPVIEDAAQAIGAQIEDRQAGSLGSVGCFSFFPSKNLGGAGDGGMLTTNDPKLGDRLKLLRVHGSRTKYQYEILGINSRLDALQAAILRIKLRKLDEWTAARQRNAEQYSVLFRECGLDRWIELPVQPRSYGHVFNQYVIRTSQRDTLRKHLMSEGIPTEIYYPSPLHLQPAFAYLGYKPGALPTAECASREVLALPIFAELRQEQQLVVVDAIVDFFS